MMTDASEDLDINQSGRLLAESGKDLPEIPLCGFLSVKYYQPFFDIDTQEVMNRILQASIFCRREQNFLSYIGEKPDGYGPFWVNNKEILKFSLFVILYFK
jgi:hypothetical protein